MWAGGLLQLEQLDFEQQRGVGRDRATRATRAVAEIGWDQECTLAADLHRRDALVPALDHHAAPDLELERAGAIDRAVELVALLGVLPEPAGVVHDAGLTRLGRRAGPCLGVLELQPARCLLHVSPPRV